MVNLCILDSSYEAICVFDRVPSMMSKAFELENRGRACFFCGFVIGFNQSNIKEPSLRRAFGIALGSAV